MGMKSSVQAESGFRQIETALDSALGVLQAEFPSYNIVDHSNRSGFEKSGFAHYLWHNILQSDSHPRPHVERQGVDICYLEPLDLHADRLIELSAFTERFHIGQESFFKRTENHSIPASEATPEKICVVARRCIQSATEMMRSDQSPVRHHNTHWKG
jgi:hypothetical protein